MSGKEFLEIKRRTPGYRPKKERVGDYREVEKRLTDSEIMEQASRCMDCGIPFCHGSGCPLSNLIPEWNALVSSGHWKEALKILHSTNNFPEFTGRVCPALCEASCTAGLHGESVAIRQVEISLVEKGFAEGFIKPEAPEKRTRKKVAVIGSGPAGLVLADQLNKFGHNVRVYEKNRRPGGLLRYGIPDFKLDKKIIDRRLRLMEEEGVVFESDISIGKDISFDFIKRRHHAVCLACGAEEPRDLQVPGRKLDGIYFAMDFLRQQNKRVSGERVKGGEISAKGKHVLVIGGGDTGSDCVGTAVRQRAKSVTQIEIMPEPPVERSVHTPWPDWPYQLRTSSSHEEGCERIWNVMTKSFKGKNGKVEEADAVKVKWDTDETGRPVNMKEVPKSGFRIKAELVLLALGFTGPKHEGLPYEIGLDLDERGNILLDENNMTSEQGVFATGDVASGASLVVRAMASARDVADNVHRFLSA